MTHLRGAVALFVLLMLSSCSIFNNSFNTYTMPNPKASTVPPTTTTTDAEMTDEVTPPVTGLVVQAVPQKIIVESPGEPCRVSPYPAPGRPPEYPAQQLLAAEGDLDRIERIERKHIDDLRAYIGERRRLNKEAREAFEDKCAAVVKH